jgi:hypothetical protein
MSPTLTASASATPPPSRSPLPTRRPTPQRTAQPRSQPGVPELLPPPRIPDPGSRPETPGIGGGFYEEPAETPSIDPVAGPWRFLPGPDVGARLAIAGLVALFVCVAALIAVAVRRRQY